VTTVGQRGSGAAGQQMATEPGRALRPGLIPAIVTDGVAQEQQRIDVRPCPVHAGTLEPRLDHQLAGAFHGPAANGPPSGLEGGILELGHPLVQIGQRLADLRRRLGLRRGDRLDLLAQLGQQRQRPVVLEAVELRGQPARVVGRDGLPNQGDALGGVGKVEDAHRLRAAVQVEKALNPLGPIADRHHLVRRLDAAPVQLAHHRGVDLLDISQARAIGQGRRRRRRRR
jgi:hypothetical protein